MKGQPNLEVQAYNFATIYQGATPTASDTFHMRGQSPDFSARAPPTISNREEETNRTH